MPVHRRLPTTTAAWVPPVLAPFAVVAFAHLTLGQGELFAAGLVRGLVWGLSLAAALAVLFAVAVAGARARVREAAGRVWCAVAVGGFLVLLTSVAQFVPAAVPELERRWQGKIIDLLWLSILFVVLRRWAREEAGLRLRLLPGSTRPAVLLIATTFVLFAALSVLSVAAGWIPTHRVGLEQIAYDATIPNLTEELLWRGALLAVLDRALGTPATVGGARLGAGVVIAAAVFGLGHGLVVTEQLHWEVNVAGGLFAAAMGLVLGWVRARTGSVWPAFLLHCAPELGVSLGMLAAG